MWKVSAASDASNKKQTRLTIDAKNRGEWEKNGLVAWCRENDISFWAWAVLEEGMLTDPSLRPPGGRWTFYIRKQ